MSETYYTVDFGVNYAKLSHNVIKEIIDHSWNNGVGKIVCISNNIKETKRNIEIANNLDDPNQCFHFTVGVHPHNASKFKKEDLEIIRKGLEFPNCFGIGEIGLDYSRMFSPKEDQIKAFRAQLALAKETNSKVYLHCRSGDIDDAYNDFMKILHEYGYYVGLIHVFYGSLKQALEYTKLGFKLGITGIIFDKRRNRDLVETIRSNKIKLKDLVVETDAPYLFPGKKSEPVDTGYIVEEIARLKNMDPIKCGQELYENSLKFIN